MNRFLAVARSTLIKPFLGNLVVVVVVVFVLVVLAGVGLLLAVVNLTDFVL